MSDFQDVTGATSLGSDWNDLTRAQGVEPARQQLAVAKAIAECELVVRAMAVDREHGRAHDQCANVTSVLDHDQAPEMELER